MKKIVTLVLTVILLLSLTTTAFATSNPPLVYSSVPTEGTPATNGVGQASGSISGTIMPMQEAGISLYVWRNSISEISTGYLKCYCYSMTDLLADKLENDYVLQQWNGTSWISFSTSTNWDTDTDIFICNIYRFVAHGYYYRIKTTHRAWLDSYYDERVLYSSYIWVS